MKNHRRGPRNYDRGFSNPYVPEPVAGLDGRRHDRCTRECGALPDEAEEERQREWRNQLRELERRLVGSEHELRLLLDVAAEAISLRGLAERTCRDASSLIRRYPKYLARLKAIAAGDPELQVLLAGFLQGLPRR